jgi:hypothetical protein
MNTRELRDLATTVLRLIQVVIDLIWLIGDHLDRRTP